MKTSHRPGHRRLRRSLRKRRGVAIPRFVTCDFQAERTLSETRFQPSRREKNLVDRVMAQKIWADNLVVKRSKPSRLSASDLVKLRVAVWVRSPLDRLDLILIALLLCGSLAACCAAIHHLNLATR